MDTNRTLTRIELKDPAYPFFVTLCLQSYRAENIIEQWVEIRHEEPGVVVLALRFLLAPPPLSGSYWLTQFYGDYKRETTMAEEKLVPASSCSPPRWGCAPPAIACPPSSCP